MKYHRKSKKNGYTKREFSTLAEAYQLLGSILVPLEGTNVRILDNLDDMQSGKKPRWSQRSLHIGSTCNFRVMNKKEKE